MYKTNPDKILRNRGFVDHIDMADIGGQTIKGKGKGNSL